MTLSAQRDAVQDLGALTETEEWYVRLVSTPTADGRKRSIRGLAAGLKVHEQTIYDALDRAKRHYHGEPFREAA